MSDNNEEDFDDLDALVNLLESDDEEELSHSHTASHEKEHENKKIYALGINKNEAQIDEGAGNISIKGRKNHKESSASSNEEESPVLDLEGELMLMEQKMQKLKKEISKKKNLKITDSYESGFTKLSYAIPPSSSKPEKNIGYLSGSEKDQFFKELNSKKSEIHSGDTDSEDEEDNREPMEAQFTSYGREMKRRLAHSGHEDSRGHSSQRESARGWKEAKGGSLLAIGKKSSEDKKKDLNTSCDPFSGIKIKNPLISNDAMKDMMSSRRMIQASSIASQLIGGDIDGDWVTIAVIVSKSETKTSQKGTQYCIWQLSDLRDCTKVISLFLFAGAYKNLWKTTVGTVIGVLNPQIMKDSNKPTDGRNVLTMSVNTHEKLLVMGTSKDLGWCKGRNKQGSTCRQFVNKAVCEFCIFHIQREYQKTCSKRAEIQSSFGRVDPRKAFQKKVLGKDQVFYGGQLFGSGNAKDTPPRKLASAAKGKDLSTLSSLSVKSKANSLREKDQKDSLTLKQLGKDQKDSFTLKHLSNDQLKSVKQISKNSEELGQMLMAPTPGARNLLLHRTKPPTPKEPTKETIQPQFISAKDFLKSNAPSQKSGAIRSGGVIGPPRLGRGLGPDKDFVIELSSPSSRSDIAKARAASIIKGKGGLQSAEKNLLRNKEKASNSEFQRNVKKRIREAEEIAEDDGAEKPIEKPPQTALEICPKKSLLGSIDVNSEKYLSMMKAKSRHTNLIQAAEDDEVEKYYDTLEKKEKLENKMASIMEVPTTAVVCLKCKYTATSAADRCREEQHPLKRIKAMKRFFECRNCKQRTMSLDKLPGKPCSHCSQSSWKRVAMGRDKKGPKLESEVLSLRGDELANYSSTSDKIYLNI